MKLKVDPLLARSFLVGRRRCELSRRFSGFGFSFGWLAAAAALNGAIICSCSAQMIPFCAHQNLRPESRRWKLGELCAAVLFSANSLRVELLPLLLPPLQRALAARASRESSSIGHRQRLCSGGAQLISITIISGARSVCKFVRKFAPAEFFSLSEHLYSINNRRQRSGQLAQSSGRIRWR